LPLGLVVSLGLAILLNTGVPGLSLFRTIFFLPSLVPTVALAILWMLLFNGEHGVINFVLRPVFQALHLGEPPNWLGDTAWSKPALVIISLWGVGHAMVVYLAGLQDVPTELYEAAELDGAGWWHKVRHVTIPLISPVILFNLIMGIIGSLQFFAVPYVMSPEGAPARSTYFLAMYLYDNAFVYLRMGYACAMAWILFVLILVLTLVALKVSQRRVYYGGA
jgi:multiple sugar transport system permease protein